MHENNVNNANPYLLIPYSSNLNIIKRYWKFYFVRRYY